MVRERIRKRVNRERYRRELKKDQGNTLRQRLARDVSRARDVEPGQRVRDKLKRDVRRGRNDIEPGSEGGDRLAEAGGVARRVLSKAAAGAEALAASGGGGQMRRPRDPDGTIKRAGEAGRVSSPTDHDLTPFPQQGIGSMQDFVSGRRPAEGVANFEQVADNQSEMRWVAQHTDGAATVVTASETDGTWMITASERNPAGRENGMLVISQNLPSKRVARERALDWIESNPDGIPLNQQAGQFGAAGWATGEGVIDPDGLVLGSGASRDAGGGDGGLVTDDDLDFVGGGSP